MTRLIVIITILISFTTPAYAGWTGPETVVSGGWGSDDGEFGKENSSFDDRIPYFVAVMPNDELVIVDFVNMRQVIIAPSGDVKAQLQYELKKDHTGKKRYAISDNRYNVGNIKRYKDDGSFYMGIDSYQLKSSTGELIATYDEKPLDLGIKRSHRALPDNQYLQIIEFEDVKYAIITTGGIGATVRDQSGFLYGTESIPGTKTESRKRVHKFDKCSHKLGYLDLPEDDIRYEDTGIGDAPTSHITVIKQYGPPVIGPDGSVYAYKRTPDAYSILKWTWVDDPSDTKSDCQK